MNYRFLLRHGALVVMIGITCWGMRQACRSVVAVTHYEVQVDPAFSSSFARTIHTFIQERLDGRMLFMPYLAQSLQKNFPAIENIEITRHPGGTVDIAIKSVNPRMIVNHEHAFVDGKLLPVYQFSKEWLAGRAEIALGGDIHQLDPVIADCLARLDIDTVRAYNVAVVSPQELLLQDKEYQHFVIRGNPGALPKQQVLAQCQAIKKNLLDTGALTKKLKKTWTADVRFDNQIVVSSA